MKTTKTIFIVVLIAFAIIMATAVIGNLVKNSQTNGNIVNTNSNTNTNTTTNSNTSANACIVTIEGQKYDVTTLRRTHSGGDVFVCNTDMTNTFMSQHNQRFLDTVMQAFKIK